MYCAQYASLSPRWLYATRRQRRPWYRANVSRNAAATTTARSRRTTTSNCGVVYSYLWKLVFFLRVSPHTHLRRTIAIAGDCAWAGIPVEKRTCWERSPCRAHISSSAFVTLKRRQNESAKPRKARALRTPQQFLHAPVSVSSARQKVFFYFFKCHAFVSRVLRN